MLIVHFIGLAMGLGTGFAHGFLGAAAKRMQPAEATKFKLNALSITMMGNIGLVLLLVSGFYLITPYWKFLSSMPWLIIKLSLVFLLMAIIVVINILGAKAKREDPEPIFKKMEMLGKLTLPIALGIVIIAVRVFH
jgi:uncharacterized membrane protein